MADAVGTVLCHDITRILPGESKGPAFRKGHVIRKEDIPELLCVGKERIYVLRPQPGAGARGRGRAAPASWPLSAARSSRTPA